MLPSRPWTAIASGRSSKLTTAACSGRTMPASSWIRTSDEARLRERAWYYSHIFADTKERDTVYVLTLEIYKSIDGGKTFETIRRRARRQPRSVDRAGRQPANDQRERRRREHQRQRRADVVVPRQPGNRTVLPGHHRHAVPVPRSTVHSRTTRRLRSQAARAAPASIVPTGMPSEAARADRSHRICAIRTSSTPAATTAC